MRHQWELVMGLGGGNGNFPTVVLSIASPKVRQVNLLLAHPARLHRLPNWHRYRLRELSSGVLRRARLKRGFGYAALTGLGTLCVKKVRAFDQQGNLVEVRSRPCEY